MKRPDHLRVQLEPHGGDDAGMVPGPNALEELRAKASQVAEEARAASTEHAYAADWRDFSAF
jgi:hypothetical protein